MLEKLIISLYIKSELSKITARLSNWLGRLLSANGVRWYNEVWLDEEIGCWLGVEEKLVVELEELLALLLAGVFVVVNGLIELFNEEESNK